LGDFVTLQDALVRWDEAWVERGAPVAQQLAALSRWPNVPEQLLTWFGWHNGTIDESGPIWYLAPSNWRLLSLEGVEREYQLALGVEADLVGWADDGFEWRDTWIPFIGIHMGVLAIDCWSGELVYAGDLDRWGSVRAPSIEALVVEWLDVLRTDTGRWHWSPVDSGGYFECDWAAIPQGIKLQLQ
jgi:hypothetical protein